MQKDTAVLSKLYLLSLGHVATKCGILAAQFNFSSLITNEPKSIEEVAKILQLNIHATRKFLRVLNAFELVIFMDDTVTASKLTPYLNYFVSPHFIDGYGAIDELLTSLKTGKTCWKKKYGNEFYPYLVQDTKKYNQFAVWCQLTAKLWLKTIFNLYDFSPHKSIIDIGGGNGELLTTILQNNPQATGTLFDTPQVIEKAQEDLKDSKIVKRLNFIGGNFFEQVPAGGDLYIICRTLLNWSNQQAKEIINQCHKVMPSKSKLVILDFVLPEHGHPLHAYSTLNDMNLYALFNSSNRTEMEWCQLLNNTNFSSFTYKSTANDSHQDPNLIMPICIIEATAS